MCLPRRGSSILPAIYSFDFDGDFNRVSQADPDNFSYRFTDRGRKKARTPLFRQPPQYLLQVFPKSEVQQSVCFIEHKDFE